MLNIPKNVIDILTEAIKCKITGCIEIHFFQGNISVVKKIESIKI